MININQYTFLHAHCVSGLSGVVDVAAGAGGGRRVPAHDVVDPPLPAGPAQPLQLGGVLQPRLARHVQRQGVVPAPVRGGVL